MNKKVHKCRLIIQNCPATQEQEQQILLNIIFVHPIWIFNSIKLYNDLKDYYGKYFRKGVKGPLMVASLWKYDFSEYQISIWCLNWIYPKTDQFWIQPLEHSINRCHISLLCNNWQNLSPLKKPDLNQLVSVFLLALHFTKKKVSF